MTWKAVAKPLKPGVVRLKVVPWVTRARHAVRPHSKPPFWKTAEVDGAQVEDVVVVVDNGEVVEDEEVVESVVGTVAVGPQEQAELYFAGRGRRLQ